MKKKKTSIVIVDDNDIMRSLLRAILRGDHYEVIGEARNGNRAVDMAAQMKPEVIFMDVQMPEKNGLEALAEIKASRPETIIIMITGNADPETVQEAIMNGAAGYIVKPFNSARVLDTLDKAVTRQRQRSS